MAINNTYRTILLEDYIKQQLQQGNNLSSTELEKKVDSIINDLDLTVPQFVASGYQVERLESSSASKSVETYKAIKQDLRALYKDMINLASVSTNSFERWNIEAQNIEKELIDLEERIDDLLILTEDTGLYHSIIIDNFSNTTKVDLDRTTAEVDVESQNIEIGGVGNALQRIFLNDVSSPEDVKFKVRTSKNFLNRTDQVKSSIADVFKQDSRTWWTNVNMRQPDPVTVELTVRISKNKPVSISRIFLDLHDSTESELVSITPLYSKDNVSYSQIPSNTFTQKVRSSALFQFSEVKANYFKFIITKPGSDRSSSSEFFSYQFGFKNIKFFNNTIGAGSSQIFVSKPLSARGVNGKVKAFEKLILETCERVEDGTSINYFVTTSNDPSVPLTNDTNINNTALWSPVSPLNRIDKPHPVILDVGDINETNIGDDETLTISYNGRSSDNAFINPAANFRLLSQTDGVIQDDIITATARRYDFVNSNERILNYQIKDTDYSGSGSGDALVVNEDSLTLFRNIGEQGIFDSDTSKKVRNIQAGWGFSDPYYYCVVEINNPEGISIDFGDRTVIIDDIKYTNKVDSTVLSGKTETNDGIHRIKVHKNNWLAVNPDIDTDENGDPITPENQLIELQSRDLLYPYNHKLLIEGFQYPSNYPKNTEQIYKGVDLFAEYQMHQISIFDLINNVNRDNYKVYSLDRDAPSTHTSGNEATRVFTLKIDEGNADFQNERFMLRFSQVNLLQNYLRLRADLSTTVKSLTPSLDSYKIKVG